MKTKRLLAIILAIVMMAGLFTVTQIPTSAATYSTVSKGSYGEDVKTLQTMLNKVQNAGLVVDGDFGNGTLTAVKNFQKANNLTVDGIVGPATWAALTAQYNAATKSTLKIGSGSYNPGTLAKGKSYVISGKITSNYKITSVTVGVYNAADGTKTSYVKTVTPNATSYDISGVDPYIKFGSLAAGTYMFRVVAKDASGELKTLVNNKFTVGTASTTTTASTLKIASGSYNPGSLEKGSSYVINGNITSNYNITSVTVGVYNSDGTATAQVKTVSSNAKSYNISGIDPYIKFGSLAVGTYSLKVVAKDASGTTKTLVNNTFKVVAPSTLKIASGNYNPGTLIKGSSYVINGKITSNYKITSVTVGIYNSDGTATSNVKTVSPNATSYDISGVDASIKFGSLAVASYKFKVTATDASGSTKTLVNNTFTVSSASYSSRLAALKSNALANWVKPVRTSYLSVVGTGRGFGASRSSGTRYHAGIDYFVYGGDGVPVYAMQSGTVIEYIGSFYYGTSAVAVQHADGTVARYCEISTSYRVGDKITRGQQIGKIKANSLDYGTMLHLELYMGTSSGSLSNSYNTTYYYTSGTKYQRRSDLVNPEFLLSLTRTS